MTVSRSDFFFKKAKVMPELPIRVCVSIGSSWRKKKFVADYRRRRGIVSSDSDGCCSARVPRADRGNSVAARLVHRGVLKIFG